MRSPSARVTINRVDIWSAVRGPGNDAGMTTTYPSVTRSGVACTVQFTEVREIIESMDTGQQRLTRESLYKIMFPAPIQVKPLDKIVWIDALGVTRQLFIENTTDEAGRGAAFNFMACERQ